MGGRQDSPLATVQQRAGAEQWYLTSEAALDQARGSTAGSSQAFDVWAAAQRLKIRIVKCTFPSSLAGLTLDEGCVALAEHLPPTAARFVLAHEIAHVLVRRGHLRSPGTAQEEELADWFARELLLPLTTCRAAGGSVCCSAQALTNVARALAAAYEAPLSVPLVQFMRLTWLPAILERQGEILCRRCGHRSLDPRCPCQGPRFRARRASKPDERGSINLAHARRTVGGPR
jgi:hypothetical protein